MNAAPWRFGVEIQSWASRARAGGIGLISPAAIASNCNDFDRLSGRSFDDDASDAGAAALALCLSSHLLGHLHQARHIVVGGDFFFGAADDAGMRAKWIGLAVDGRPVLLRPELGLLGAGGEAAEEG